MLLVTWGPPAGFGAGFQLQGNARVSWRVLSARAVARVRGKILDFSGPKRNLGDLIHQGASAPKGRAG